MSKKSLETPYPTFLELIRLVASALDLKNSNKKLDEKARSLHVNPFELREITNEVICQPIRKYYGDSLASYSALAVTDFYRKYHDLVASVSVDGLRRQEVYPYLGQGYFSMWLQYVIADICKVFSGPSPSGLLDEDSSSIGEVLICLENTEENWLLALKSMSKENRDRIGSWKRGSELPSSQSIHLLKQRCCSSFKLNWDRIYVLLLAGRSLDYVKRNYSSSRFLSDTKCTMLLGEPEVSFNAEVVKKQENLKSFYEPVLMDIEYLNSAVLVGDIEVDSNKVRRAIDHYRSWLSSTNRKDVHGYLADWIEAKWNVRCGDLRLAKLFYCKAFESSIYRAGSSFQIIARESFIIASCQSKPDKILLKKIKWAALLFGFDIPVIEDGEKYSNKFERTVEKWEIESAKKAFWRVFDEGGFLNPGVKDKYVKLIVMPGGINVVFDDIRPDFRNPNRVIKIGSIQRKIPQLVYFVMFNKHKEVKRLIELGADVNACSEVGDSAIMLALGSLNPSTPFTTLDRSLYDIIVECDHKPETLNLSSHKKKLTAIMEAVQTGQPEIVHRIIEMGANPDLRSGVEQQTPLNEVLKMLTRLSDPESFRKYCEAVEMSSVSLDGMRRNLPGIVSSMDETKYLLEKMNSSEWYAQHKEDFHEMITSRISKFWQREKLIKIAEILIDSGSDVNAVHKFPVSGYTPLMLAAELNEVEVFKYMLEHGGDPKKSYYKPDSQSYDCYAIAKEWDSKDVLRALKDIDIASEQ
ncbi:ankyrin repeat domain-containing protein [Marinospirillum sp.]|uniref:ankyrin repeat domain-containing protein n=1 Tax=Marinospirillum sp. TaxID=2183934 RepID=UPI00384AF2DF